MRTGQPIISRPAWYDRNPVSKGEEYTGTVGPHEAVVRLTYTCPADKRAMVELLQIFMMRTEVATEPYLAQSAVLITPAVGDQFTALSAYLPTALNNLKDTGSALTSGNLMLHPGDVLEFWTWDGSTGGTIFYGLSYKLTEFDA